MHYAIEILDHNRGTQSDVGPVFAGDNRKDLRDALKDTMTSTVEHLVEGEGFSRYAVETESVRFYRAALITADLPGESAGVITVEILPSLYSLRFHRHPADDCTCQ